VRTVATFVAGRVADTRAPLEIGVRGQSSLTRTLVIFGSVERTKSPTMVRLAQ
jgi:hypothetical protein